MVPKQKNFYQKEQQISLNTAALPYAIERQLSAQIQSKTI